MAAFCPSPCSFCTSIRNAQLLLLLLITFAIVPSMAVVAADCGNCNGRGTVIYNGTFYCECKCNYLKGNSSAEIVLTQFLPPTCRYATTQTQALSITVGRPLSEFIESEFRAALFGNLTMVKANDEIFLERILNNSATQITVLLQFRSDHVPRQGFDAHVYYSQLFSQDIRDGKTYISQQRIVSSVETSEQESPGYTEIFMGTISGFELPLETVLVFFFLCLVAFTLSVIEIICSDNFIVDEAQGNELLERAAVRRMKAHPEPVAMKPSPKPKVNESTLDPHIPDEPEDDWLKDEQPEFVVEEEPQLKRKGTRSLKQYASNFYQNA